MNKEALRKELEDAFIAGFASKGRPLSENLPAYITTRLAALLSGEDWISVESLDEIRKNCVHEWAAVEQQWGVPNQSVCLKCGEFRLDKI